MNAMDRLIVALDVPTIAEALAVVAEIKSAVGAFKLGYESIYGMRRDLLMPDEAAAIENLRLHRRLHSSIGMQEFTDAKLDDIPRTVRAAADAIVATGVRYLNIHVSAGPEAMQTVVESAARYGGGQTRVLGVTVLTSHNLETLKQTGNPVDSVTKLVVQRACLARAAGCDGVIAAPKDIVAIREVIPDNDFLIVTPGVRPAWAVVPGDDQSQERVMTPSEAIKAGASALVIGRPILKPPKSVCNRIRAALNVVEEIEQALNAA